MDPTNGVKMSSSPSKSFEYNNNNEYNNKNERNEPHEQRPHQDRHPGHDPHVNVVIVGAGIAGLTCARHLLEQTSDNQKVLVQVTLLEASNSVGGRIQVDLDFCPGYALDLGAECIHGPDSILTNYIEEFRKTGRIDPHGIIISPEKEKIPQHSPVPHSNNDDENKMDPFFYQEVFITEHAHGGPSKTPTHEGKYGMYFVRDRLLMYDHAYIEAFSQSLEEIIKQPCQDPNISIHQVMVDPSTNEPKLTLPLYHLGLASYANSAGCIDLSKLSLSMMHQRSKTWDTNRVKHDYRLPSKLGMFSLVQALTDYLQQQFPDRFALHLNCPVTCIQTTTDNSAQSGQRNLVNVTIQEELQGQKLGESFVLRADHVIVSVPPPILPRILPDLTPPKLQALELIGFTNICKIICKFSHPFWPSKLQSIVSADGLFPEVWFRSLDSGPHHHLVIFLLADEYADEFIRRCKVVDTENNIDRNGIPQKEFDKALIADMCISHLAQVLEMEESKLQGKFVDLLVHDWKTHKWIEGGVSYPRVGLTVDHLLELAAPMDDCIYFCGEATNTNFDCTVQGSMETGIRAASEVICNIHKPTDSMTTNQDQHKLALVPLNTEQNHSNALVPIAEGSITNFNPQTSVSKLIQRQIEISRSVARQEEQSFRFIQAWEQNQLELTQALADQEDTSFRMVQALEQLSRECQQYKVERDESRQRQAELEQELESVCNDNRLLAEEHEQQIQHLEDLERQIQYLSAVLEEKDAIVQDRESKVHEMAQKILTLRQEAKVQVSETEQVILTKDSQLRDRDAIIKIMAQKHKLAVQRANDAEGRVEQAQRMVRDQDAIIRIMAQKMKVMAEQQSKTTSQSKSIPPSLDERSKQSSARPKESLREYPVKVVHAVPEEKGQQIASQARGEIQAGKKNDCSEGVVSKTSPASVRTAETERSHDDSPGHLLSV